MPILRHGITESQNQGITESQNQRITETENGRGWTGCLEIIYSKPLAQACANCL